MNLAECTMSLTVCPSVKAWHRGNANIPPLSSVKALPCSSTSKADSKNTADMEWNLSDTKPDEVPSGFFETYTSSEMKYAPHNIKPLAAGLHDH